MDLADLGPVSNLDEALERDPTLILPPLPKVENEPETSCIVVINALILATNAVILAVTLLVIVFVGALPPTSWHVVIIYVEFGLGLACFCGVFFSKSSVIPRTKESCFPIPTQVE